MQERTLYEVEPSQDITSLQSHMLEMDLSTEDLGDTLSWIISALSISTKIISAKIRRARLIDIVGGAGSSNIQGEAQQKLDVIANETLLRTLGRRKGVAVAASEESARPIIIRDTQSADAGYCVLFDPLDGSSNIDVCGGVGTIFSILRSTGGSAEASVLQAGTRQVAAGYVLYGSSTVMVLTLGDGVTMFVLDPDIGSYVRVEKRLRIPEAKPQYSVNEGNRLSMPAGYQRYLNWAQEHAYSARYVGTMVADVHRILLTGGVFLYPPTDKSPAGKLRLLYEANPMALVIEQAGGKAVAAPDLRLLDIEPETVHQRTPVVMGSPAEVDRVLGFL
jgi:fructose-1,6-bisphosphatase I